MNYYVQVRGLKNVYPTLAVWQHLRRLYGVDNGKCFSHGQAWRDGDPGDQSEAHVFELRSNSHGKKEVVVQVCEGVRAIRLAVSCCLFVGRGSSKRG